MFQPGAFVCRKAGGYGSDLSYGGSGGLRGLSGDTGFGEVVGGEFQEDFVTGVEIIEWFGPVAAIGVGDDYFSVREAGVIRAVGKGFRDGACGGDGGLAGHGMGGGIYNERLRARAMVGEGALERRVW